EPALDAFEHELHELSVEPGVDPALDPPGVDEDAGLLRPGAGAQGKEGEDQPGSSRSHPPALDGLTPCARRPPWHRPGSARSARRRWRGRPAGPRPPPGGSAAPCRPRPPPGPRAGWVPPAETRRTPPPAAA